MAESTITRDDIMEARRLDARKPLDRGRLNYLLSKCQKYGPSQADPNLAAYVAAKLAATEPVTLKAYTVPWAATMKADPFSKAPKELGRTDVMWLERLPRNPVEISDDDARRVAALAMAVEPRSSDDVLMRSIFGPIKAHHERLAADAELTNARRLGNLESERAYENAAATALGSLIHAEEPNLKAHEAVGRARDELAAVHAEVAAARAQQVEHRPRPPSTPPSGHRWRHDRRAETDRTHPRRVRRGADRHAHRAHPVGAHHLGWAGRGHHSQAVDHTRRGSPRRGRGVQRHHRPG